MAMIGVSRRTGAGPAAASTAFAQRIRII
jgi:hypothetical protein